jgi:hypothetical protein
MWINVDKKDFTCSRNIFIRTSGFRIWAYTIQVTDSCRFECYGDTSANNRSMFCWLGHYSSSGTCYLKNLHLRACAAERGRYIASIYVKGGDDQSQS